MAQKPLNLGFLSSLTKISFPSNYGLIYFGIPVSATGNEDYVTLSSDLLPDGAFYAIRDITTDLTVGSVSSPPYGGPPLLDIAGSPVPAPLFAMSFLALRLLPIKGGTPGVSTVQLSSPPNIHNAYPQPQICAGLFQQGNLILSSLKMVILDPLPPPGPPVPFAQLTYAGGAFNIPSGGGGSQTGNKAAAFATFQMIAPQTECVITFTLANPTTGAPASVTIE